MLGFWTFDWVSPLEMGEEGQTSFGPITLGNSLKWSGGEDSTEFQVFLRPEQVRINPSACDTGVIVRDIQNYGSHQWVEVVSCSSGESLLAQVEAFASFEETQSVSVDFVGLHTPVIFPSATH